jgi:hypothetical protein
VSRAGTKASAFSLQYESATGKRRLALPAADVPAPAFAGISRTTLQVDHVADHPDATAHCEQSHGPAHTDREHAH